MKPKILLIDDEIELRGMEYFYKSELRAGKKPATPIFTPEDSLRIALGEDFYSFEETINLTGFDRVIIDLGLPVGGKFINFELQQQLHQLACASDVNRLVQAFPEYRKLGDPSVLILNPDDFTETSGYTPFGVGTYPFGVLLAKQCKEMNIPFTVYTNDWDHGRLGITLLACAGIVPVESIVEVLKQHLSVLYKDESERTRLFVSADKSFAIGYKWHLPNWQRLINILSVE